MADGLAERRPSLARTNLPSKYCPRRTATPAARIPHRGANRGIVSAISYNRDVSSCQTGESRMAEKITSRASDYSQWYLDIVHRAGLAENSEVRGCMVIKPHGYAIWEKMQRALDRMFKDT